LSSTSARSGEFDNRTAQWVIGDRHGLLLLAAKRSLLAIVAGGLENEAFDGRWQSETPEKGLGAKFNLLAD
jgi:hypothetical protein